MIRLLTAATMAALLAAPALAQGTSPPQGPAEQPSQLEDQGTTGPSGLTTPPEVQGSQIPVDCTPNDPRPECQTAQMPSDQSPGSGSMAPGTPSEREYGPSGGSGSWGEQAPPSETR